MLSAGGNSRVKLAKRAELDDHQDREETGVESAADVKVRGYVGFEGGSSFGGPQRDGRFRGRGRVSEFRPSRGGRGSGRGRGGGGGFPPRDDRDPPNPSAKYNEPVAHSNADSWSQTNSSNKYYDRSDVVVNLPEDPRISKLLRRLCAEPDIEKSLAICGKLKEAVMLPDNARYIRRSYDILVESLLDVFYDAPGPETKNNAAIVLGRIGFVMEHDYRKHLEWIGSTYETHNSSIKHLLISSLSETFRLDSQTPTLSEFSNLTLNKLQSIIERTDISDVFMAAINVMIIMSESYPEDFANHFVDTVDILVGWHVDNAQTKQVNFALNSLLKLSRHWQADVRFSINLLTQFVEDMVAYSNDLDPNHQTEDSESNSPEECKQKITAFLNVFNTVVKSLGNLFSPNVTQSVTWTLLIDITTKILHVLIKAIDDDTSTDLITAGNECIVLLLDHLQAKSHSCLSLICQLISLEMENYLNSEEEICLSILNLISKAIKEISSNLSIEFIVHVAGPESLLRPLRYSESSRILEGTMLVYSNLLNLKNIPLLQETYKFVLTDLHNAYSMIVPDVAIIQPEYSENISVDDAESNVIFYLQCLSELANASNSIIGMWALQPSILELLAIKMSPHNDNIIRDRPALQYSILYLLYSHCKKNNHFIASSDLVTNAQQRANDIFGLSKLTINDVTGSSPTSGHLAVILNLLALILDREVSNDILILVLNWIGDIFSQVDKYLPNVCRSEGFLVLVTNMLTLGHRFNNDIVALVLKNLQPLLNNKNIKWSVIILKNIAVLCLLHVDNRDKKIIKLCADVIVTLPWDIVQLELDKQKFTVFTARKISHNILTTDTKLNSFKDYLSHCCNGNLSNEHFKMIMNCLLQPYFGDGYFLINTFLTSWSLESQEMHIDMLVFFRQCVTNFSSISTGWCLSELAQTCVSLKLRTVLGKPLETFIKIEGALKGIARETSSLETKYSSTEKNSLIEVIIAEQIRSRWIIEFMMFLEKYVYNAADGTAVVLQPVAKPVRTFFHTNWPTCREWLTRVRPAALAVSLYSGNYGAAIYHAQLILHNAANSTTNMDIEAITMSVARAFIKIKEPEVLLGLYIWIKQTFNKKFHWLKAVAEQANTRYDLAIEYYKKITSSSASPDDNNEAGEVPLSETRYSRFIDEQVMDCYKYIQNWDEMIAWKDQESNKKKNTLWDSFTALKTYEDSSELPAELCDWDVLDLRGKDALKNSFSYQNTLNKIESALVFTAVSMCYSDDVSKYDNLLTDCETLLQSSFEELNRNSAVYFLKETAVLQLANQGLKAMVKNGKIITNPFQPSNIKEHKYGTELENLAKINWWNQYFTKFNITDENIYYSECLRLDVIKSARKNCNYSMAKRELMRHFKNNSPFQAFIGNVSSLEELQETMLLSGNAYEFDIWNLNNATAFVELCKLTYGMDEDKTVAINLCASVSLAFSQRLAMGEQNYELREKGTRMLLTLSKWVQNENENILGGNVESSLRKLILALPEIGLVDNNISENVIPVSDSAVGKLLQFGVNQCPGLAKAWANFASWCFRWGRKMVEFSSKTGEKLTDNDKIQIENVMIGCSAQDFEAVCDILSKTKANCDDEDIDWNEINTSAMIETQLRSVPSLSNAFPEHIALLVDIWRQAQKRVFSYFELSADAYFKFLQLICASDYINHSGEYAVVSATLRLLRLIVKHAMELQTVLESGLANTPTQPWKVIIPQLFSRLNHPETYVRKCVSDLLCRLAEDTPHLITFPAVVGAVENEQNNIAELSAARSFIHDDDEGIAQELFAINDHSDKVISNDMNSCFLDMVETLSKQAPKTILQVKLLVRELQRINLLWDELWLGTLAQHHSDFTKRLAMLETEIIKVKENAHLSAEEKEQLIKEKHHIIFDPIVFVIQQINHVTSVTPETPHEISFQSKFQNLIDEVIDKLKNPVNPEKPQESWQPLKQLQIKLQQKVNKRTSYILKMSDISPVLAELKNTVITMPGVHTHQRTMRIKIRAIENSVAILPTKTRPKKLVFYGSDGKAYTYLFKGLEDLHLDERIMQLLSITNTMLARDSENNDNQTYRARHYSVIPLGPRSGLISWVENVTPLFALYKRWQNREAAIVTVKTNRTVSVARPSELFYTKLNPKLKEAGISTEYRKEWPVSILRQVLSELSAETPKDLLWRELWCGSVNSEQWWQMVRRYSYSVAVMSIIGYIIGLGDRHLDNVLVDLTSGEVVHIDYNVCFEKGKTLRVPEKVPFRMTPNLVTALGVTGVEGIFRLACEHVLRVMRRGRETLLTLLEAFVYDPLVEWGGAAGNTGHKRKKSQRDAKAAVAMLAVRSTEYRQQLLDNTEKFLAELPEFIKVAEKWLHENEELKNLESRLQECHQQLALIKEIEAYGNNLSDHPLYAKSTKYTSYKQAKNAVEDSMKTIVKMLKEYDSQIETYVTTNEDLNGPQFMAWVQDFANPNEDDDIRIFDNLKDFLTNAGQSALLTQCEQAEAELLIELKETRQQIRHCLDLLSQYLAMSQYYPQTRTEYHRIVMFRKWLAAILESKSPDVCREVAKQMQALVNADNITPNSKASQQIMEYQYRLQAMCGETNEALAKANDRLELEGGPDGVVLAQEAYREAKASLSNWVRTEEGAPQALESVVIGMLCNVNRRYLVLENGAQSAGDCLVDLTSRDGEWFLDEMNYLSIQAVELLSLLPLQQASAEDPAIPLAVDCVRNMNLLLSDLIQLNYNFSTIILPEILKKVHSEDPSTLQIISELNAVVLATPVSLNELVQQLDLHYRYLVMDMESPANNALLIAAELRTRFEALLTSNTEEGRTSGGAVVLALSGWFSVAASRAAAAGAHVQVPLPPAWRKVDQLHDSMHLCAALQSPAVRMVLEQIFFVRRVQCIMEILTMCSNASQAFMGSATLTVYSPQAYCNVVRRFTAEFVSRCCLGVGSRALAVTLCLLLRRGAIDLAAAIEQKEIGASWSVSLESLCALGGAGSSEGGAARVRRVCSGAGRAARAHGALREHTQRAQHARAAVCLHAAHATTHATVVGGAAASSRATLSLAGRRLLARAEGLARARDKVRALLDAAHMRVKWGAGANPALRSLETCIVSHGAATLHAASSTHVAACRLARAAVARGHTGKADQVSAHAHHTLQACTLAQKYALDVTPVEESLMEMLHPEGNIDQHWVQSVSALVTDMLASVTRSLSTFGTKPTTKPTSKPPSTKSVAVRRWVTALASCRATRMALCGEFRPTLLTLQAHAHGNNPVSEYITREQSANEQIRLIVEVLDKISPNLPEAGPKDAASAVRDGPSGANSGANKDGASRFKDGASEDEVRAALVAAEFLQEELPALTELLLELSSKWSTSLTRPLSRQPAITSGSHHGVGGGGAGVWRRVLHKLEGRHLANRRTPRELVDHIIAEATNTDNLCLMYEGWMAWV